MAYTPLGEFDTPEPSYVEPDYVEPGYVEPYPADQEPPVPRQGKAIRYIAPPNGPIDIDRGQPLPTAERDRIGGLQAEMLEAIQDLRTHIASSNGFRSLSPTLDRYRSALDHPLNDLRDGDIETLYARGLRIQAAYDDLQEEIAKDYAPPEDRRLRGPMQVLLSLHGPFLQSTQRGLELYEQTDRDRRTQSEDLALKEKQRALLQPLRAEAKETVTEAALDEVEDSTEMIGGGRHPERASVAGRNTSRNFLIAYAELARRWVRSRITSPIAASKTITKVAAGAVGGEIIKHTAVGTAAIAAGASAVDAALGAGGLVAPIAADFMVRHASDLRELARAGGAGFNWLITFLDWLVPTVERIRRDEKR